MKFRRIEFYCRFMSKIPFNRKVVYCRIRHENRKISLCRSCSQVFLPYIPLPLEPLKHLDPQLSIDFNE